MKTGDCTFRRCPAVSCALALGWLAGCAHNNVTIETRPGQAKGMLAVDADARAEAVRKDPIGYMRRVAEKCAGLKQYTMTFTRLERRGFFRTLKGPERIACKFRQNPFSIYMKWLDPDVKYGESVYVAGREDDKVRFLPRRGLFGLKPRVTRVHLQTPVFWGEARRPLTEFGLERLMKQSLAALDKPGEKCIVKYLGLTTLPDSTRTVHHLYLEYPNWEHKAPIQELFVDVQTDIPAATILKFKSGRIDAAYFYEDVNPRVVLTDDDFVLEAERQAARAPRSGAREASSVSPNP